MVITQLTRTVVLVLAVLLALVTSLAPSVGWAAQEFVQPVPGQRVFDVAGALSAAEEQRLEELADALAEFGAPTVVYLQAKEADYDETEADARALMDAWEVQSEPGARDGIVIFYNLEPNDLRHGQVALYAGAAHTNGGALPQRELRRIFQEVMRPLLAEGELVEGTAAGLRALAASLQEGPKPARDPALEPLADAIRIPLNTGFVLAGVGLIWWAVRKMQSRPSIPDGTPPPLTVPPSDLPPAYAGALVAGTVNAAQLEGSLFDLAQRGALSMEPVGRKRVQLQLLNPDVARDEVERAVWQVLEANADQAGVVPEKEVRRLHSRWGPAKEALRNALYERGWFDPSARHVARPLYVAGVVGLTIAALGLIPVASVEEWWGLIGIASLFAAGLATIIMAASMRETTTQGEWAAQPWRGYKAGLHEAKHTPEPLFDLDEALPYAVALGTTSALKKHLKAASEAGHAPAWFARTTALSRTQANAGFYPYFLAIHAGATGPVSTGAGGAGASSGGAGAGGGF